MSESGFGAQRPGVVHHFSIADFDALAAGGGDAGTIQRLIASEYSRRLLLLYELLALLDGDADLLGPLPPVDRAWKMMRRIERKSSGELRAVLLHPQVGVWFTHTLRRISDAATDSSPIWVAAGQIYSVILAAAVRSGTDMRMQVPVRRGIVAIPTLGSARIGPADEYRVADAESRHSRLVVGLNGRSVAVEHTDEPTSQWWNLRRLRLPSRARTLEVMLDDIDPYRDLADPIEPRRLDEGALASWHERLGQAWRLIDVSDSIGAEAMQAGFWSVTPLPDDAAWEVRSASTGDAFGAVLMSLPPDPVTMAVTLVHEFQHNKLGALLHLLDLTTGTDRPPELYAPWRPDPRPAGGMLQGVYAFLGITAFWHKQRSVGDAVHRQTADFEFALARRQVWAGLHALRRTGQLTAWGRRFLDGMAGRLRPWLREHVAFATDRAAWAAFMDHRAGWRIRNLEADPLWIREAVTAWRRGLGPPPIAAAKVTVRTGRPIWGHQRLRLYRATSAANTGTASAATAPGDMLLLQGHARRAEDEYLRAIAATPDDFDAWTGLGLAVAAQPGRREWRGMLRRPELVKALHDALTDSHPGQSPMTTARWLVD